MPAIALEGGLGSGHGCFPPRPNSEGDPTFLINGVAAHAEGMAWETHSCGDQVHPGVLDAGSPTFLLNGKQAGRVGDPVDCGSAVAEGDDTFFVGD